ncbi:MAG: GTP-binding protein [Candidatus Competibacteraceae bacterium]|jgi:G3E family GTPase|nr:GTP-binding protein [Candidatus Competibacteraceae bacterium]
MTGIPVVLLTGFLGSGKTTLLSQLLKDPRYSDTAVVINELGEIDLDHYLVETSQDAFLQMTFGCVCCTVRGDIRQTLLMLHERSARGEIPTFARLVIEANGLADPAPVMHTLMTDPSLTRLYTLAGVVTTFDAVNGLGTLDRHEECLKQVAVADRLVLGKIDLLNETIARLKLPELRTRLRKLNPGAELIEKSAAPLDPAILFAANPYDPTGKNFDVQGWLREEAYCDANDHEGHDHVHHAHDSEAHTHDSQRHGDDIHSYCLIRETPLDSLAFTVALDLLKAHRGEDLLRVKGIVNLRNKPDRPLIIQGVQHVFHEPLWLDGWPSDDQRTRIVFVTRNLPKAAVEEFISAFGAAADARTQPATNV